MPGQPARVTARLTKLEGTPIRAVDDLLVMHTERIHLLIVDRSLLDYHHEHPVATDTPGEYAFTFTPRPAHSLDKAFVSWPTAPLLAA